MKSILMCPPKYFEIKYEINPWMSTLNNIDYQKAFLQYTQLKQIYDNLKIKYNEVFPNPSLPDQVFTTDVGFAFNKIFLKANFKYNERKKEADIAEIHFKINNFKIEYLPSHVFFEGGDLIKSQDNLFLGYGKRTSKEAGPFIEKIFNKNVVLIKLDNPYYYHLDTLFCPLNSSVAMIYKDALSKNESDKLSSYYKNIIEVTKQDIGIFACNSIVSGNNIVMPFGISEKLKKQIEKYEFNVFEIEFSEYLKGGGAIHCASLEIHD